MPQELSLYRRKISIEERETGNLLGLFFNPEDGGEKLLRNEDDFQGLHGVMPQNMKLFIREVIPVLAQPHKKYLS
jgi:hypothetical protein